MTSTEAIDVFIRFVEMKEGKENGVIAPHDVFIDACKLAISALQDRPIGHWIKEVDFGNCPYYVCSECGEEDVADTNYCSNCGAKMVEN